MKDSELINHLKQASEGLLWLSESDYPFETVYWENLNCLDSSKLLQITGHDLSTKVEVRELDQFFQQATEAQDWYNAQELAECQRYQALVNLLQTHLKQIKVYRVGQVEIDVYILGKTESGSIAGLSTKVVET
ncbi:MAG: nuclease A inhibitor family protein [Stanieria sp.]